MPSKIAERIYLDSFIKSVGWPVEHVAETEEPDFLVTAGGRTLGVEVRQLFKGEGRKGSPARRDERERAVFLVKAAEHYYTLHGPPINVKIITPTSWHLGDPAAFARHLVSAVPGGEFEDVEVGEPFSTAEPQIVITRLPASAGPYRRWRCIGDSGGWVRRIGWQDIEGAVREKAARLGAYRQRVNEVVLLLVADRGSESSMLQYEDAEMSGQAHGFSAIYWQEYLIRSIRLA